MGLLSQVSKLFNFNVFDLADFMIHHWFPVSFFVLIQSHTCLQYVLPFELRHQLAVQADWSQWFTQSRICYFYLVIAQIIAT